MVSLKPRLASYEYINVNVKGTNKEEHVWWSVMFFQKESVRNRPSCMKGVMKFEEAEAVCKYSDVW